MSGKPKRNTQTTKNKKVNDGLGFKIILIIVWLLAGLYLGMAGWLKINYDTLQVKAEEAREKVDCNDPNQGYLYRGIRFCTLEDIRVFQHLEQMENTGMTLGFKLPDPFPMVFSAFAFGVVGSIVNIFRLIAGRKKFPELRIISTGPALGGLTALMLIGLSYLVPSIFTDAKIVLTPIAQPFLGLFAGAFSEQVLKWFQAKLNKILKSKQESE